MQTYGLVRNYNATEDFQNGGAARRRTTQAKINKMLRRRARRNARQRVKEELADSMPLFVAHAEAELATLFFDDDLRIIEPFFHFPPGTSEAALLDWIGQLKFMFCDSHTSS